ncbi:hypothetical protein FQN57_001808 [Myotisia sp. PD_48]|nr:hypothetical protein FQN57_001808 [Myotisia sp. PD_48]
MAETMRAVDIKNGAGPASALFVNPSVPKPIPSATQCLVHVKAFALNRADTLQRSGFYPPPPGASKILGLEFSGVIDSFGTDQGGTYATSDGTGRHWKVGDEVLGLVYGGAYAEYVVVDVGMLIPKPAQWTWEFAAGICEVWFTALQALYLVGEYKPETTRSVLWHAGASAVSIAGIQLSRRINSHINPSIPPPKVFATTRNDEKCTFCVEKLGCAAAINTATHSSDWDNEIKKLNDGAGMDLIVDYVGPTYFQQNINLASKDGHIVLLGLLGGGILPDKVDIRPFLAKRLRFEGSTLRSRDLKYQIKLRELFEVMVLPELVTGEYNHHVDSVFKWEDVGKAHELLERNATKGKLVCTIDW